MTLRTVKPWYLPKVSVSSNPIFVFMVEKGFEILVPPARIELASKV